jgi:hypothetical protein
MKIFLSCEDKHAILQEIKKPRIANDKLKKAFEYYFDTSLCQNEGDTILSQK